ncbi:Uncharacterized protein Y057_7544 [Fusarium fujikuroi]|nr:Uncharacterized protein Y057_7544 [Fusarium fujikuroi]
MPKENNNKGQDRRGRRDDPLGRAPERTGARDGSVQQGMEGLSLAQRVSQPSHTRSSTPQGGRSGQRGRGGYPNVGGRGGRPTYRSNSAMNWNAPQPEEVPSFKKSAQAWMVRVCAEDGVTATKITPTSLGGGFGPNWFAPTNEGYWCQSATGAGIDKIAKRLKEDEPDAIAITAILSPVIPGRFESIYGRHTQKIEMNQDFRDQDGKTVGLFGRDVKLPSERKPVPEGGCELCGSKKHLLADCIERGYKGHVNGCSICNSRSHYVDSCSRFKAMSLLEKIVLLVQKRANRPPLKTSTPWWEYLHDFCNGDEFVPNIVLGFPWSPSFCQKLGQKGMKKIQEEFDADPEGYEFEVEMSTFQQVHNTYWRSKSLPWPKILDNFVVDPEASEEGEASEAEVEISSQVMDMDHEPPANSARDVPPGFDPLDVGVLFYLSETTLDCPTFSTSNTECSAPAFSLLTTHRHRHRTTTTNNKNNNNNNKMSSRSTRKRPASGELQAGPAKRGRPTKADRDSQVPQGAISRATARHILDDNPSITIEAGKEIQQYEESFCAQIENWDPKDEKTVQDLWDSSKAKSECKKFIQKTPLLTTWRISLRLYNQAPVILFSEEFNLRYQSTTHPWAKGAVLSGSFCEALCEIMVHPCWEQDPGKLALGLQWTSVCRIDDRRYWELTDTYDCPVLEDLDETIKQEIQGKDPQEIELDVSYAEMLEESRCKTLEDGNSPSAFSSLLYQINKAVAEENSARPPLNDEYRKYDEYDVVPVTLWDLQVLSKAINATQFKAEWNYSTKEASKAWNSQLKGKEFPAMDMLPLLYELSYKDLFRRRIVYDREERQSTTSSASGSVDENQPACARGRRSRQVLSDSDEEVLTRTHSRNGPTLSQAMPQIPPAPTSDSPSYQQLVEKVKKLESEKERLRGFAVGYKHVSEALKSRVDKLEERMDKRMESMEEAMKTMSSQFGDVIKALGGANPGVDRHLRSESIVPPDMVNRALDAAFAEGDLGPAPEPEQDPEPAEEETLEPDTEIPETSEKQATPPAGSTPEPTLPTVDSVQEDDVETNNVSGIPDVNTKTQAPSNGVRWTVPGMRPGTMHSIRKVMLPERHFVSREGNAAVRYPPYHIVHRTLQAKKSKWLAEVCKEMK